MSEVMNTTLGMLNVTTPTHEPCYATSPDKRRVFLYLYMAIIIVGIPCNVFSLYVSWQHIRQRNDLGVYLFNLALADLLTTTGLSLLVSFMWRGEWHHGEVMCYLSVILLYSNLYASDGLLCCIAMNRYLAVVHPLKYAALRRRDTAGVISAAIWVLVVTLNSVTVTWVKSGKGNNPVCFQLLDTEKTSLVNVTRFLLGFLFPVLMVSFCCRRICAAVRTNRATEEQERRRVFRLLGVVLVTLGLCFGPIHILMLFSSLRLRCDGSWYLMYNVSMTMSALNILADPFLYCFVTRLGKAHVTQVVHFLKRTKKENSRELVRLNSSPPQTSSLVHE
ncbi:hypothetical protein DPEC_G00294190 [Dallia pectoralis]|uniref:Uncharacterized protein n=1 Tax=Dallia pectoralis TaxID=75939 RepID=A0ACC2FIM5_DALPE|nr:hypothetical protein DPEC_G00294190 [Dallia pectoralis]